MKKLSIIMPVYNEAATLESIVDRVLAVELPLDSELLIIDDCSTDGSHEKIKALAEKHPRIRALFHPHNRGKGAAIRTGFSKMQGDLAIIQDADLEYDPHDYLALLQPILEGQADVVYGSRFSGQSGQVFKIKANKLANQFLTKFSNLASGLKLSDMETCYKLFKTELLEGVHLSSERFGIEVELTALFAKLKASIVEVPVSYQGRDHQAGKKIGYRDGLEALWAIIKFNWLTR
jgi:glycosyltransferase involved in cell wall biosynthesis